MVVVVVVVSGGREELPGTRLCFAEDAGLSQTVLLRVRYGVVAVLVRLCHSCCSCPARLCEAAVTGATWFLFQHYITIALAPSPPSSSVVAFGPFSIYSDPFLRLSSSPGIMSSTLPRTRSVSAASTSSSGSKQDRIRPVSVCDTSWSRMTGQELRQQHLVRTPSQANNLCTTVPQNLVVQNLGGRHTPTRSSLRHSRMIVLSKNGKGSESSDLRRYWRWDPSRSGQALECSVANEGDCIANRALRQRKAAPSQPIPAAASLITSRFQIAIDAAARHHLACAARRHSTLPLQIDCSSPGVVVLVVVVLLFPGRAKVAGLDAVCSWLSRCLGFTNLPQSHVPSAVSPSDPRPASQLTRHRRPLHPSTPPLLPSNPPPPRSYAPSTPPPLCPFALHRWLIAGLSPSNLAPWR
ncbi:hypothetical protein O3P69_004373 [Scylla paramamosain]|uniref:Uncharacterized protein n=1 Tax=Scylla paramamosain TaxID=85552 RepID=A0AAW0UCN9_SCYPA